MDCGKESLVNGLVGRAWLMECCMESLVYEESG